MPYVTSVERIGIEKGLEQGLEQGRQESILEILEVRFGTIPEELTAAIALLKEDTILTALLRQSVTISDLAALRELVDSYLRDRPDNPS
ncbi:hypothetical protein [Roseofilum casamattae]|uniref:DUF4351 domain-containing protein n=1 Tax=Roseofilum casamattae BLCC-M143 TaxID=3022442 RepID=A0ABT7C2Q5_9CYAN|nr:hypothetical protein [Roseofilum casamattae]MDJ1185745.1 hypothetical protein [Roseofilum casamattae BLCC-M143]